MDSLQPNSSALVGQSQYDSQDSRQLLLKFTEHNMQRVREENVRIKEKLTKLQTEYRICRTETDKLREVQHKLQKTITQNIAAAQSVSLTNEKCQKAQILKLKQRNQSQCRMLKEQLVRCKEEIDHLMQANLGLIKQNDEFVRDNKALSDHIDQMNIQMKGLEQKLQDNCGFYEKRIRSIEKEKVGLMNENNDMKMQLKIVQQDKQIQRLLVYERKIDLRVAEQHRIVKEIQNRTKSSENQQHKLSLKADMNSKTSEKGKKKIILTKANWRRNGDNSSVNRQNQQQVDRQMGTAVTQQSDESEQIVRLREIIRQKDEIIILLKQKNARTEAQLNECVKRNKTLQQIICNKIS